MKRSDVIDRVYNDYFFSELLPEERIPLISSNTHLLWLIRNMDTCAKHFTIKSYAKSAIKSFNNLIRRNLNNCTDELLIEKITLHTNYCWFASLERLLILGGSIDEHTQIDIFGLLISDIYVFSCLVIFRTFLFNTSRLKKTDESNELIATLIQNKEPKIWFDLDEIIALSPSISRASLQLYLQLFSRNLKDISTSDNDVSYIYKNAEMYAIIFIDDYANYVFSKVEKMITNYLQKIGNDKLEEYKRNRGKNLETSVYDITRQVFDETYQNLTYVDLEAKKREIDIISFNEKTILVECKSSYFNLYEHSSDYETRMKIRGAFGNTLKSVKAVFDTLEKSGSISLKRNKQLIRVITQDRSLIPIQVTLYPIDIVGTYLHNFDPKYDDEFKVYPININYIDYFVLLYLAYLNKIPFLQYLETRSTFINKYKDIDLDIDELSVFGFLTDPGNEEIISNIKIWGGMRKLILYTGDEYRIACNEIIANYGIEVILSQYLSDDLKTTAEKLFAIQ